MRLQGLLYLWIGLMGLAGTVLVWLLLRAYPRAFSDSGASVVWPWRRDAGRSARVRGALMAGAGIVSLLVAVTGIVRLLAIH